MESVATRKPYLTIRPTSGWAALNLAETWNFRDLLLTLAGRDVRLRYRQTLLGAAWVILQPLMAAGIFTIVFGMIAGLKTPGELFPYFVFAFAGQLGWGVFFGTLGKSSGSMLGNSQLVSKVYFPRLVLPLSTVFSTLIDFAVAMVLMVVLMLYYNINPGLHLLMLPVWMALLLMLALGVGLGAAALMVSYRDVQYIMPVFMQMLMYLSPVGYSLKEASAKLSDTLFFLYMLNPAASLLEGFRWSLLGQGTVMWGYTAYSTIFSVVVFVWGMFAFRRMERKFADVI